MRVEKFRIHVKPRILPNNHCRKTCETLLIYLKLRTYFFSPILVEQVYTRIGIIVKERLLTARRPNKNIL